MIIIMENGLLLKQKSVKRACAMLIMICIFLTGCGGSELNTAAEIPKGSSTDVAQKGSGRNDIIENIYDIADPNTSDGMTMLTNKSDSFITEVYEYFTDIGYSDRFSVGIISILLTESGGDPSYVEYSNKYADESDAFLSHKNDSKKDLIEAYHSYGNIVFADNAAETDMYRDDEGNYCVGVGIMLWTGNRGYEVLSSANNDWTELAFQLDYLADQLNDAELTPEKTKDLESYEDAINTIAYNFLMVPEDSAHLDEYMYFIDQVENVISD